MKKNLNIAKLHKTFSGSVYASRVGRNQRLSFHVIQSFMVNDIFECVLHCQHYEECVSVNFENAQKKEFKRCELSSKTKSNVPGHMILLNEEFDYYNIIKP